MKKYLMLVPLLFSTSAMADFVVGGGTSDIFRGGDRGNVYRLGWEHNEKYPVVFHVEYFEKHDAGKYVIDDHVIFSAGKRLIDYELAQVGFYGDLGVALTTSKSAANSSNGLFFQEVGLRVDDYSLYLKHTSNCGITGKNLGETHLGISYKF